MNDFFDETTLYTVPVRIFHSSLGWFFGAADENGNPFLRESGYFPTNEAAAAAFGSCA